MYGLSPDAHDAAFEAEVAAARGAGAVARLQAEVEAQAAEGAALHTLPAPGTDGRARLDAWARARSRRVAVCAAAVGGVRVPRAPNAVGESPCELAHPKAR